MCASFVFTQTFPAVHVFVSWFLNLSSFLVSGFQVCRWVCMNTSCSSCVLACPSSSHFASLAWLHGTVVYCYKKQEFFLMRSVSYLNSLNTCVCLCVYAQPRGSTFPMLEGPDSQETEEDKECVITPSTSVKFNAALRERNRINFMRNYLLLIGTTSVHKSQSNIWCKLPALINVTFLGTAREGVSQPPAKNEEVLVLLKIHIGS